MYLDSLTPVEIRNSPGALCMITGGMKADKTKHFAGLFDRLKHTGIRTQVFKPECDYRKELHDKFEGIPRNYVVSRTGIAIPAIELNDEGNLDDLVRALNSNADIIGFEETHLYTNYQQLFKIILAIKAQRKVVVTSGLDRDFRGEAFPITKELMVAATKIDKLYGWCDIDGCDNLGELSQRLINGQPALYSDDVKLVGASEAYEARCLLHHEIPGKPKTS